MTLIVVEGLNSVAKTDLAVKIAETLGYLYFHYPVNLVEARRLYPRKQGDYHMAMDMLNNPPDPSKNLVLDCYYQTQSAYGGRYAPMLESGVLPAPDYTFLLDIDPLLSDERSPLEVNLLLTVERRQEIAELYKSYEYDAIIAGSLTPTEMLNEVLGKVTFNSPLN